MEPSGCPVIILLKIDTVLSVLPVTLRWLDVLETEAKL